MNITNEYEQDNEAGGGCEHKDFQRWGFPNVDHTGAGQGFSLEGTSRGRGRGLSLEGSRDGNGYGYANYGCDNGDGFGDGGGWMQCVPSDLASSTVDDHILWSVTIIMNT